MSDRVSTMARERNNASVIFLRFMRLVSKDRSATACFFEGEDQKYYSIRLDMMPNEFRWFGIDCAGKKNVIALHTLISGHEIYKQSLIAFFVDSDFDEPISQEQKGYIYETQCYSIENFYCTDQCLSRILTIEYKLDQNPDQPDLLEKVLDHFKALRRQFHEHIRPLNVWIKAHRRKEKLEGWMPLNLNNVSLDKFVKIERDAIVPILSPSDIPTLFPGCYQLSADELRTADEQLPDDECHSHFRGKYELDFVHRYLSILRCDCGDRTSRFYNPGRSVKLTLSKGNLISELSNYAETPACLKSFLNELVRRSLLSECPAIKELS